MVNLTLPDGSDKTARLTFHFISEKFAVFHSPRQLAKDAVGQTPWRLINRARSLGRARCGHAFQVIKHLWGFTKVRCRGLAKNTARLLTAFALSNLYLLRRRLLPSQAKCLA
jgi:IS5 family transposase